MVAGPKDTQRHGTTTPAQPVRPSGAASLAAAKAGYAVTHVDSSKPALNLARENQAFQPS